MASVKESKARRFVADDRNPVAQRTHRRGGFAAKLEAARAELGDCYACPRDCGVNRLRDEKGVCHVGRRAIVASAFPHFGEENCLRGRQGSGTIFFSYCNLKCVFCQNWDISSAPAGREMDAAAIADIMLELQEIGCHNINFVTPEHVAPQVVEAVEVAIRRGLDLPIVYNTSAYDALSSLQLMDGIVDVYMPDFKFWKPDSSRRLVRARDYPERAREAIQEMHRQVGDLVFDDNGLAVRGLLVRHLVMPGLVEESAAIFRWLAEEVSPDTYVNIMGQYRPEHRVPSNDRYAEIDRRPTRREMVAAYEAARGAGLWRLDERWM